MEQFKVNEEQIFEEMREQAKMERELEEDMAAEGFGLDQGEEDASPQDEDEDSEAPDEYAADAADDDTMADEGDDALSDERD